MPVMTVCGARESASFTRLDAHNHVWIAPVPGGAADAPVLDRVNEIRLELFDFRTAGGQGLVDCQPGGCGRDANLLQRLSSQSGVAIIACTGFHLSRYYPPERDPRLLSANAAAAQWSAEITQGMRESLQSSAPVRAGYVKAALEADLKDSALTALEGAAQAALQSGAALAIHTQKGAAVEEALAFLASLGLPPSRIILFHMDKRPDRSLLRELAQRGALLEIDTFYREPYQPELHLWPLIAWLAAEDLTGSFAIGTDMAQPTFWQRMGGSPGLTGLLTQIHPRLVEIGLTPEQINAMLGGNIARRLAFSSPQ